MDGNDLGGLIIGGIAVAGGMGIGIVSIVISVPWAHFYGKKPGNQRDA